MAMKTRLILLLLLTFLGFLAVSLVAEGAGKLYLRSGQVIEVDVWEEQGDLIYYQRFGGRVGVPKTEILRIEGTPTPRDPWRITVPAEPPPPPPMAACAQLRDKVTTLEAEIARLDRQIEHQEREVDRTRGGLVRALNMTTLATLRQTRAQTDQRRLDAVAELDRCLVAAKERGQ